MTQGARHSLVLLSCPSPTEIWRTLAPQKMAVAAPVRPANCRAQRVCPEVLPRISVCSEIDRRGPPRTKKVAAAADRKQKKCKCTAAAAEHSHLFFGARQPRPTLLQLVFASQSPRPVLLQTDTWEKTRHPPNKWLAELGSLSRFGTVFALSLLLWMIDLCGE